MLPDQVDPSSLSRTVTRSQSWSTAMITPTPQSLRLTRNSMVSPTTMNSPQVSDRLLGNRVDQSKARRIGLVRWQNPLVSKFASPNLRDKWLQPFRRDIGLSDLSGNQQTFVFWAHPVLHSPLRQLFDSRRNLAAVESVRAGEKVPHELVGREQLS